MTDSWVLSPVITYCSFCNQEWACRTQPEADAAKVRHEHLRHGQPMPERQLVGSDWQAQAIDAVRTVAARGTDFIVHEALVEFGIGDPPNAKTALGKFATLMHDLGIAHPCGFRQSTRTATKRSALAVWNRDPTRCTSPRCQQRRAS